MKASIALFSFMGFISISSFAFADFVGQGCDVRGNRAANRAKATQNASEQCGGTPVRTSEWNDYVTPGSSPDIPDLYCSAAYFRCR